jgi:gliding motility-associated-like protein
MNRPMKYPFLFFLLYWCIGCAGQTITPSVINSAGMHRVGANGISLTDNVGEPFTSTIGNANFLITQGFLQPGFAPRSGITGTLVKGSDITCKGRSNQAHIYVDLNTPANITAYTTEYLWSTPGRCKSCKRIDTLTAGEYSVRVAITYTTAEGVRSVDTLDIPSVTINEASGCIKPFTGVTPNNDGANDVWFIENITEFPKNKVVVFNRWGVAVFETNGYDNKTKAFPPPDILNKLPASTYFYIIDLGDGSTPIKGWLELFKSN